ncbi:MAG: zinc-binding dehydrogenase [Gammaproteobacteria bacterium]|nr:zinc-binding dehydrogenase [Gammaproteobacteria bacterium]
MLAQVVKKFGPAKNAFEICAIKTPTPNAQHMLIKVEASSVNPVDCKLRTGQLMAITPDSPTILHGDVAGTVVAVGNQVSNFKVGDLVYGCAGGFKGSQGAIAEYMLVDPDLMALRPTLDPVECAALPLVAITAWEALIDRAAIKKDQTVLIHAASGGVGSLALQLALWRQAKTFVTASNKMKAKFALECGATVINYKESSVADYVKEHTDGVGFDVVLDTVGGSNLANSIQACKEGGAICAIAGVGKDVEAGLLMQLYRKGISLHYTFMPNVILNLNSKVQRQHYGELLTQFTGLVNKGIVTPLVGNVFNFTELGAAHECLERGEAIGKIGLRQDL